MVVFSQFSDEVREAHVGSSWSLLKSQEAQIAAQARLAVGILQRLEGQVNSVAVSELVHDLEAGKMSLSEVIERLQDAPPDEEPAEGNDDSEEKPPTMASLQAKHLASSEVNYRRALRPNIAQGKTISKGERFVEPISNIEKQVIMMRGPAAYSPNPHADSTLRPNPQRVAFMPTAKQRLPPPGANVQAGARGTPMYGPFSSVGAQVSSDLRSMPSPVIGVPKRPEPNLSPLLAARTSRIESLRSGRKAAVTPGPGAYNS